MMKGPWVLKSNRYLRSNIHVIEISEGEEWKNRVEEILGEKMTHYFLKLLNEKNNFRHKEFITKWIFVYNRDMKNTGYKNNFSLFLSL